MKLNELLLPTDVGLVGHARLELIDPESRKVLERIEGENYVTSSTLRHNRWAVRQEFNSDMSSTAGDPQPFYPLGEVHLCDSDRIEVEPSGLVTGRGIAWANKASYSGADAYRGTVIWGECSTTELQTVWVFEWPTTAGNGTIRGFGWRPTSAQKEVVLGRLRFWGTGSSPPSGWVGSYTGGGVCIGPDGAIWTVVGGTPNALQKYQIDPVTWAITSMYQGPTATQCGLTNAIYGVCHDGTDMYVIGNGTNTVRKFTIPTGTGDVTESGITIPGVASPIGIACDGTYLWVAAGTTVYRANKSSGVVERSFTIAAGTTGLAWDSARSMLFQSCSGTLNYYDLDGVLVGTCSISNWYGDSFRSIAFLPDGTLLTVARDGSSGGNQGQYDLNSMGTKLVLGYDVVKTNLTAMKLTYTFTFS